jgi:hypothetical protein
MVIVTLIGLRKPDALLNPQPYAEDGAVFLQQALGHGYWSLLIPYAGYLHFIPRIVTLLSLFTCGLAGAPFAMNLSSLLLSSFSVWYLCLKRFRVLVRNDLTRYVLSFLIASLPVHEIFLNITNIQWFLSLFITLWAIDQWVNYANIPLRANIVTILETAFAAFAFLTSVLGFLAIPILAVVVLRKIRDETLFSLKGLCILVPSAALLTSLFAFLAPFLIHPTIGLFYPVGWWFAAAKLSVLHVVLTLLIPSSFADVLLTMPGLISLALSIGLTLSTILLIYVILRNRDTLGLVILGLIGLALFLTVVFRSTWMFAPDVTVGQRFLFYPMSLLAVLLVRMIDSKRMPKGRFLIGVILIALSFNAALHYQIPPFVDLKWGSFANQFSTNGNWTVDAPTNPLCGMQPLLCWTVTIPVDPQVTASKLKLLTQVNGGEGGLYYLNGGITAPGQIYNVTSDTGPLIDVVGWAIDQDTGKPAKSVFLVIDGNLAFPTAYGLGPPEFQYGPSTQLAHTDWWTIISTHGLSPGIHIISIWVVADDGLHYYSIQIATVMIEAIG